MRPIARTHGATILLASHNMLEVERLCDRVIIMKRGRIEDDDSPDEIMARYNRATLEEVFLDVARGRVQETARREHGSLIAPGISRRIGSAR